MPVPTAPLGESPTRHPVFTWRWSGRGAPRWTVVLLDEQLDEIARMPAPGPSAEAVGAVLERLTEGERFHWYVEGDLEGRTTRSAPAAFGFPQREAPLAPR